MYKNIFKYGPPTNLLTAQPQTRNTTYTSNLNNSLVNYINSTIDTTIDAKVLDVLSNNLSTTILALKAMQTLVIT